MTGQDAVRAHDTAEAIAYAGLLSEGRPGRIAPRMLADLTVAALDALPLPAEELRDMRVLLTMVDRRIAYEVIGGQGAATGQ